MSRTSYFSVLFLLLAPFCLSAQTGTTSAPASPPAKGSSVLFGTTANVENGANNKGSEPGVGDYEPDKKNEKKKKGEFAFAPIPVVNPSIGNGGGFAVLYAVHLDSERSEPPSTFALGGFATGNGSVALALGARLYLKADKYRITVGGGGGRFNYNYFGTGNDSGTTSIPLSQRSNAFLVEPKIRIYKSWYLGPRYHIISSTVSLHSSEFDPNDLPIPLPDGLTLGTAALGVRAQRDTADSTFYPRRGSFVDGLADFFAPQLGGVRTYQNVTLSYNKYLSLGPRNVLAIRGSACMVTDKAPFYDLCQLGFSKDIRGYQIGQFRDNRMLVGQMEFRRELFWRFGATVFAGAGAVAHTWPDFSNSSPKPGGGFGLRFVLAKQNHINLRTDFAWGENSRATYVSLGEVF